MIKAFEAIFRQGGRKPIQLQTDQGKEFYNRPFQTFLHQHQIHHFSTHGDAKASTVERFNRTLKQRMYRYFTAANTLRYVPVLQDFVPGYNRSVHRSIGMPPQQVTHANEQQVWNRLYAKPSSSSRKKAPEFKKGDWVRLNKKHRVFQKAYLPDGPKTFFK